MIGAALLVACGANTSAAPQATLTPVPAALTATPLPAAPQPVILRVWLIESLGQPDSPLRKQVAAFDDNREDVQIAIELKRMNGVGGIRDYLKNAPAVAPSILPDLVLLDRDGLVAATSAGLTVSLDDLAGPDLVAGLYPVARDLGTVGGNLTGLAYLLALDHLMYRPNRVNSVPASLDSTLAVNQSYAFAAGAPGSVNSTLLLQYSSVGGRLVDDAGLPVLDAEPLTQVLEYYREARAQGVFNPSLLSISDPAVIWDQYRDRVTNMAVVTSSMYLAGRGEFPGSRIAAIPTAQGTPVSLVDGLVWALFSTDLERQSMALLLINSLLNTSAQAAVSQAGNWLPSQPAAFATWQDTGLYQAYDPLLVQGAIPMPELSMRAGAGAQLQKAFEAVLVKNMPVLDAVTQALAAVDTLRGTTPP
jgi:ABC-type glycerol-3-phosphate transport system substrate-binding protein